MASRLRRVLVALSLQRWLLLSLLLIAVLLVPMLEALTADEAQDWRRHSNDFDWQQLETDAHVRIHGQGVRDTLGDLYFVGSKTIGDVDGAQRMFVARLSGTTDAIVWTREFGDAAAANFVTLVDETAVSGGMSTAGEVLYVAGTTWSYMDNAAHALNGFGQFGGRDVVLLKLSLDGDKVWSRQVRLAACGYRLQWRRSKGVAYTVAFDAVWNDHKRLCLRCGGGHEVRIAAVIRRLSYGPG